MPVGVTLAWIQAAKARDYRMKSAVSEGSRDPFTRRCKRAGSTLVRSAFGLLSQLKWTYTQNRKGADKAINNKLC